jgi:hypothetical protein
VTAWTREPRMPTQVPIGSMRWSLDFTAILARGTRGIACRGLDLEKAFLDLGHLELEELDDELPGAMRDRISCGTAAAAIDA